MVFGHQFFVLLPLLFKQHLKFLHVAGAVLGLGLCLEHFELLGQVGHVLLGADLAVAQQLVLLPESVQFLFDTDVAFSPGLIGIAIHCV